MLSLESAGHSVYLRFPSCFSSIQSSIQGHLDSQLENCSDSNCPLCIDSKILQTRHTSGYLLYVFLIESYITDQVARDQRSRLHCLDLSLWWLDRSQIVGFYVGLPALKFQKSSSACLLSESGLADALIDLYWMLHSHPSPNGWKYPVSCSVPLLLAQSSLSRFLNSSCHKTRTHAIRTTTNQQHFLGAPLWSLKGHQWSTCDFFFLKFELCHLKTSEYC